MQAVQTRKANTAEKALFEYCDTTPTLISDSDPYNFIPESVLIGKDLGTRGAGKADISAGYLYPSYTLRHCWCLLSLSLSSCFVVVG